MIEQGHRNAATPTSIAGRKPFLLRIDADLYSLLARWAEDERRSLNGQIEFLLRRALATAGRLVAESARSDAAPRHPSPPPARRSGSDWDAMED